MVTFEPGAKNLPLEIRWGKDKKIWGKLITINYYMYLIIFYSDILQNCNLVVISKRFLKTATKSFGAIDSPSYTLQLYPHLIAAPKHYRKF